MLRLPFVGQFFPLSRGISPSLMPIGERRPSPHAYLHCHYHMHFTRCSTTTPLTTLLPAPRCHSGVNDGGRGGFSNRDNAHIKRGVAGVAATLMWRTIAARITLLVQQTRSRCAIAREKHALLFTFIPYHFTTHAARLASSRCRCTLPRTALPASHHHHLRAPAYLSPRLYHHPAWEKMGAEEGSCTGSRRPSM